MPLHGEFIVNDAQFSPLLIYGVGTFLAYSGNGIYRNQAGCVAILTMAQSLRAVITSSTG